MIEKSLHDSTVDRSYVQRVVVMHKFISFSSSEKVVRSRTRSPMVLSS